MSITSPQDLIDTEHARLIDKQKLVDIRKKRVSESKDFQLVLESAMQIKQNRDRIVMQFGVIGAVKVIKAGEQILQTKHASH